MWAFCNSICNNCGESCLSALVAYQFFFFPHNVFCNSYQPLRVCAGVRSVFQMTFLVWDTSAPLWCRSGTSSPGFGFTAKQAIRRGMCGQRVEKSNKVAHKRPQTHSQTNWTKCQSCFPTVCQSSIFFLSRFFPYQVEKAVCLILWWPCWDAAGLCSSIWRHCWCLPVLNLAGNNLVEQQREVDKWGAPPEWPDGRAKEFIITIKKEKKEKIQSNYGENSPYFWWVYKQKEIL